MCIGDEATEFDVIPENAAGLGLEPARYFIPAQEDGKEKEKFICRDMSCIIQLLYIYRLYSMELCHYYIQTV